VHHPDDLIRIFNTCFRETYHTVLVRGDDEPIYLPAKKPQDCHAVHFAHGFFSSALHECAHWLIAGSERRTQVDYGYWYEPDGRNAEQQRLFQSVEVKPQALEWLLSRAAKFRFQFSIDNLNGAPADMDQFKSDVYQQALTYQRKGLPKRAQYFRDALLSYYEMLDISQPTLCDSAGNEWLFLD